MSFITKNADANPTDTSWVELIPECPANTWRVTKSVSFYSGFVVSKFVLLGIKTTVGPTYHHIYLTPLLAPGDSDDFDDVAVIGPGQSLVTRLHAAGGVLFPVLANYAEYEEEPRLIAG